MSSTLKIDRVGIDRYGRTLARVAGERGDPSCSQLGKGRAVYQANKDNGYAVARTCPGAAL